MGNLNVASQWPLWRKIVFRFLFIFLSFLMAPWTWLDAVPGVGYITQFYSELMDWAVNTGNAKIFHVREVLVPLNGSGDTSYGWAQLWLLLSLAVIGCIIWSLLDRKCSKYPHLNYWLCLFARYYIAMFAFVYGILKIFALQMYFPSLHQLATPLGDFLPMRFSWLFIGYSTPYQVFSGVMETLAGLLLLYRRTSTLGAMLATAVFINVMVLNLAYDIPVKIFSMELVFVCLFLLANESSRIICFFILNKPAAPCDLYHFQYTKKWMRITRVVLKIGFIIIAVLLQISNDVEYYQSTKKPIPAQPVNNGVYEVAVFAINKDSLPLRLSDTMRWQDVIFENGLGSIKTSDTAFRRRYNRAYFVYSLDSVSHTLALKKQPADSVAILNLHYDTPDSNTVRLWGRQHNDSLYVVLKRMNRHFQLAEKQFHWLSESNR
jgi:hypothetical protein